MMRLRYSELKKMLRKAGCQLDHDGGRHEIWYSPITGEKFPVGRHDGEEVRTGTLKSIKRAAGLK